MQRFDPTASLRGRNRYPAFDTAIGNPQDGQLTPNNALLPPPYKGPAPMQEQSYATGVKPGSETLDLPMPQQAPDAMAEFQKLGLPPRRQQVERGRQSTYAPFVQALSGLGDVFAAKAGQRGNYLDRTIGLQQGQIEQEYGDRLRNAGTQFEGDQAAYNQRVQGMNLAHQLGRETVADKAREWTQKQHEAEVVEGKRRYNQEFPLKQSAEARAKAESDALLKQMAGLGGDVNGMKRFLVTLKGWGGAAWDPAAQLKVIMDNPHMTDMQKAEMVEYLKRIEQVGTAGYETNTGPTPANQVEGAMYAPKPWPFNVPQGR